SGTEHDGESRDHRGEQRHTELASVSRVEVAGTHGKSGERPPIPAPICNDPQGVCAVGEFTCDGDKPQLRGFTIAFQVDKRIAGSVAWGSVRGLSVDSRVEKRDVVIFPQQQRYVTPYEIELQLAVLYPTDVRAQFSKRPHAAVARKRIRRKVQAVDRVALLWTCCQRFIQWGGGVVLVNQGETPLRIGWFGVGLPLMEDHAAKPSPFTFGAIQCGKGVLYLL